MTFRATLAAAIAAALLAGCGGGDATMADAPAQGKKQGMAAAGAPLHVFPGLREDYRISHFGEATAVTLKSDEQQTVQVPADATLRFDDSSAVFGKENSAARILRLYQAAFGRAPDAAGLRYWMGVLEQGEPLDAIAAAFAASAEYQGLYGKTPTAEATVNNLYKNVLRREGDAAGFAYWLGVLNQGIATAPQVLASFSESPENQKGTRDATENGVALFEPGVAYKPVARPGPSEVVLAGTVVRLDGTASSGPGKLGYRWTMASKPAGSQAALAAADTATPTFTPDVAGDYRIALTVSDGVSVGKEASLQVTARVIPDVWKAAAGKVPASGNYVYLEGAEGDAIVGNSSKLYKGSDAYLGVSTQANLLYVSLVDVPPSGTAGQRWLGIFKQSGNATRLAPGYYADAIRNLGSAEGPDGLSWSSVLNGGRICNTVQGWFVFDKVSYNGKELTAFDLRFEQRCDGSPAAMHGQIHWDAANLPAPVLPVPAGLWSPSIDAPVGNYVYLESAAGDHIGGGKTRLYTEAGGAKVDVTGAEISANVKDGDSELSGHFTGFTNLLNELQAGYYDDLRRHPSAYVQEIAGPRDDRAAMDWSGKGQGCTSQAIAGWFTIDSVTYAAGKVKTLDARFAHSCGAGGSPLYGKIHWAF